MEHGSNEFAVTVQDVRQLAHEESNTLTLLWMLEGNAELERRTALPAESAKPDSH